jgi:hypothetical protein
VSAPRSGPAPQTEPAPQPASQPPPAPAGRPDTRPSFDALDLAAGEDDRAGKPAPRPSTRPVGTAPARRQLARDESPSLPPRPAEGDDALLDLAELSEADSAPAPSEAGQESPQRRSANGPSDESGDLEDIVDSTLVISSPEELLAAQDNLAGQDAVLGSRAGSVSLVVGGVVGMIVGAAAGALIPSQSPVLWTYAAGGLGWACGFVFTFLLLLGVEGIAAQGTVCGVCRSVSPAGASICGLCGSPLPQATIDPFIAQCMSARTFLARRAGTIYWAAMVSALAFAAYLGTRELKAQIASGSGGLRFLSDAAAVAAALVAIAYLAALVRRTVASAFEDPSSRTPSGTLWDPRRLAGGLGAAVVAVLYALPLVTFPLLPVAVLAASLGRWSTACSPWRVAKLVASSGREFALLWLMILLWSAAAALAVAVVLIAVSWSLRLVPSTDNVSRTALLIAARSVAAALVAAGGVTFVLAALRCVGVFGARHPMLSTGRGDVNPPST